MAEAVAVLSFAVVVLAGLGLRARLSVPRVPLWATRAGLVDGGADARRPSYFERRIRPLSVQMARRFSRFRSPAGAEAVEQRLEYAGRPQSLDAEQFFGLQVLGALAGLLFGCFYVFARLPMAPLAPLLFAGLGYYYPRWWLSRQAARRQEQITLALPTVLDLLAVCLQAGMGLDAALDNIASRMKGPLSEELRLFLGGIRLGAPRREAFRRLLVRNPSSELQTFVGAVMQAEDLGVPLASTVEAQADEMRFRRGQRARDKAAKASPKISLVAVFLIAPSALFLLAATMLLGMAGGAMGGAILP